MLTRQRRMMRNNYIKHGVEGYYQKHSNEYKNPHEDQIRELLLKNMNQFDSWRVLDLCCGGGEVTKVLVENGIENVSGIDKYTSDLYKKNTVRECAPTSFNDILRGKLDEEYSVIICSFAIHLVPEEDLLMLVNELFRHTETFIIIAPHKRPFLERIPGVRLKLIDYSFTPKGKKVYLRIYKNTQRGT